MSRSVESRACRGASYTDVSAVLPRRCPAFFRACLLIALLGINALVLFAPSSVSYNVKRLLMLPNIILVLPGLMGVAAWVWAFSGVHRSAPQAAGGADARLRGGDGGERHGCGVVRLIVILTFAFAAVQAWLVSVYRFSTGWDVRLVSETAWQLAQGMRLDEGTVTYFQIYPNNLLLLWVSTACMRLAIALGATTFASGEMVFALVNCLSQAVAALALYATLDRLLDRRYALVGWVTLEAICLLSPWVSIPYSDALALAVPPLMAWCYVKASEGGRGAAQSACTAAACGFVGVIGYRIKPQTSFLLIAIGLVELLMLVSAVVRGLGLATGRSGRGGVEPLRRPPAVRREGVPHLARRVAARHVGRLACIAVGCLCALTVTGAAAASLGIPENEQQALGPAHFLMMGTNDVSDGGYLTDDVAYSLSYDNKDERTHADLSRWAERMEAYGPTGFIGHSMRKALSTYADGAFSWGAEGGFYKGLEEEAVESGRVTEEEVEAADAAASDASHPIDRYAVVGGYTHDLRGLILSVITSISKRGAVWWMLGQALWLPVLALVTCAALPGSRMRGRDRARHLSSAEDGAVVSGRDPDMSLTPLALIVAMLGLVVFEFFFEARARYLYSSLGLFVMLAMVGLDNLTRLVRERRALTQHAAAGSSPRHQ